MIEDVYLPHEIARAAGVPVEQVLVAVGGPAVFVRHADAVRLGRSLAGSSMSDLPRRSPLFASFYGPAPDRHRLYGPLAIAGVFQLALAIGAQLVTPAAAASPLTVEPAVDAPVHLVFIASAGPGGGGGGGGLRQASAPSKAQQKGAREVGNPVPVTPVPSTGPNAPLPAEPFPVLVAPIAQRAADLHDRPGAVETTTAELDSRGPGQDGGAGTGAGSGVGQGNGSGIGPGSGGGFGGGVFRPGSGVDPPRLLREVKPDYPESARRRGIEGEVVLELVVRRDGTTSDIQLRQRLGPEFDDRAIQAVRQWRFEPGRWRGTPVDVAVEVAVEFRLR